MSVHVTARVWKHKRVRGSDLVVLLRLADDADESGFCWPSVAALAEDCGLEERQLRRSLRALEEADEIAVVTGRGRGNVSAYMVLTGLDAPTRVARLVALEQRATELNAMLRTRRDRAAEARKGDAKDPIPPTKKGTQKTPLRDEKGSSVVNKRGHVGQKKGDMAIGDFGSGEPKRNLTHHHDPSCDPSDHDHHPSIPDAADAADGGGDGERETLTLLQQAGVVTAASFGDVPPDVAAAAIAHAKLHKDAAKPGKLGALVFGLLTRWREGAWTPPPPQPPEVPTDEPSDRPARPAGRRAPAPNRPAGSGPPPGVRTPSAEDLAEWGIGPGRPWPGEPT